jgi:hypothetical protein
MAVTFPRYQTRGDHQTQIHAQYTSRRRSSVIGSVGQRRSATRRRVARQARSHRRLEETRPKPGDGAAPVALEKRTSVAEAVKARLFTARLKPCPSLDGLCPGLLGSPKASCTGQIGQCHTLDINRKSTTIRLWINWGRHLRLCLIPPVGR